MKKVAIITRTKDRPILLKRAYESVLSQTFKNYTWVVVNDGGNKDSIESIINKAKNNMDVIFISNEKSLGMEAASNLGIKSSNSEYIVIHDDDDSWDSNFLKETIEYLDGDMGELYDGVVTHSYKIEEELLEDECKFVSKCVFNGYLQEIYLSDIAKVNTFPPISFLYRRSTYKKIQGYDETLPVLGDWHFNLRFLEISDIGVIQKSLANYHHRINNVSASYGNTVVQGVNKHRQYDAILRNRMLREDIKEQKIGLGHWVNIERDFQYVNQNLANLNINKLKSLVKKILRKF